MTDLTEYELSVKQQNLSGLFPGFEDVAGLLLVLDVNTEYLLTHQTAERIQNLWKTSYVALLKRIIDSFDYL